MSKELLALEDIILYLNASEPKGLYCENIETIQQALLELQSIKEANPSEALEAFGRITLHTEYDDNSHYDGLHFEDDCKLVDKALEFLEAIENANHSEALNCLECLYCESEDYRSNDREKDYEYVKQALLKAEKEHKALEIIKEKNVSVCGFRNRVFGYHSNMTINDTYEYYLNYFGCYHNGFDVELLTKEEFDLLKEVLE